MECAQVEAMRNFEGEEVVRGRRVNVLAGLELHRQLLSGPEERQLIEHIRSWVAAVRRTRPVYQYLLSEASSCGK